MAASTNQIKGGSASSHDISTIDHIAKGRLTVNIISFTRRKDEKRGPLSTSSTIEILKQCWTQDDITYHGEENSRTQRNHQQNGGPLLYEDSDQLDVFLMWPETDIPDIVWSQN